MTLQDVLEDFRQQVERETSLPCVLGPSVIRRNDPTVNVLPRKVKTRREMQGDDDDRVVLLPLIVRLRAKIEGAGKGLGAVLNASDRLAQFLSYEDTLEDSTGTAISDITFSVSVIEEDGFAESEEAGQLFEVADSYLVEISVPRSLL